MLRNRLSRAGIAARFLTASVVALAIAWPAGPVNAQAAAGAQRPTAGGQDEVTLAGVDRLLAAKPKDPALRFQKGVLLSDAKRNAEAEQVFERLTEDYPDLPEPYNNLAVLYAARGDYERARVTLGAALRANPRYAVAQANLGDVHLQLAQQSYQRALGLDPKDATLPARLAALRRLTDPEPRPAAPP